MTKVAISTRLEAKNKPDVFLQLPGYPNYRRTLAQNSRSITVTVQSKAIKISDGRGYATVEEIESSIKSSHDQGGKPIILLTISSNPQGNYRRVTK